MNAIVIGSVVASLVVVVVVVLMVKRGKTAPKGGSSKVLRTVNGKQGLVIEVLREGSGAATKNGSNVAVHYRGWLEGGKEFDNSAKRGKPLDLKIGEGRVIKGWEDGLLDMKVGEKRRLKIPPAIGYGVAGRPGVIPPNATLYFEVELVSVK